MTASEQPPSVVVPGNHDGVHRGHRALLAEAHERARGDDLRVVALFFDPHPLQVLAPDRAPPRLTTPSRRETLLRSASADDVARQPFDTEFSKRSPESFARDVLARDHGARSVVVGPDFRFGHGRAGDVAALRELGARYGFDVRIVDPVRHGERIVSSSLVRQDLQNGDVTSAADLLTRVHEVEGTVVEGDRRGRAIGFPTANLHCDDVLLPGDGIYAVAARRLDVPNAPRLEGVASLGVRPTFEGAGRSVEVYFFDFDGDLYGARLRVGFVEWIRGEEKFDGVEQLKVAMEDDVRRGRAALDRVSEERLAWI